MKILETVDYFFLLLDSTLKEDVSFVDKTIEYYEMMDMLPQGHVPTLDPITDMSIYDRLPRVIKNDGINVLDITKHISKMITGIEAEMALKKYMVVDSSKEVKEVKEPKIKNTVTENYFITRQIDHWAVLKPISSLADAKESETFKVPSLPDMNISGALSGISTEPQYSFLDESQDSASQVFNNLDAVFPEVPKVEVPNVVVVPRKCAVLYNSLYGISLVVQEPNEILQKFLNLSKEFKQIMKLPENVQSMVDSCNTFFHKKVWESEEELIAMSNSFCKLYKLQDAATKTASKKTEREMVQDIIKKTYIISNDSNKKIKAVQLYTKLTQELYPDVLFYQAETPRVDTQLNKRLATYFMELGLTRKRYTDGIYYYGLELKEPKEIKKDLEELFEARMKEQGLSTEVDCTLAQIKKKKEDDTLFQARKKEHSTVL